LFERRIQIEQIVRELKSLAHQVETK